MNKCARTAELKFPNTKLLIQRTLSKELSLPDNHNLLYSKSWFLSAAYKSDYQTGKPVQHFDIQTDLI